MTAPGVTPRISGPAPAASSGFADAVARKRAALKFSGHAQEQMAGRRIALSPEQMDGLRRAVDLAEEKGAKTPLVLLGDVAVIVSVPHRTVVTAIAKDQLKERVFTNIDSAVIL